MSRRSDEWLYRRQKQIDKALTERVYISTLSQAERTVDQLLLAVAGAKDRPGDPIDDSTGRVPSIGGAYSAALGAQMGRGFSITSTGVTGNPVGCPPGQTALRVRIASPHTIGENKRTWGKVKKSRPKTISLKLWRLLEQHYGHGYKPWQIAEQIKPRVKERTISQNLTRARKLAKAAGINFK
jgi:hypothetical protein